MKRLLVFPAIALCFALACDAQKVSVRATDEPASTVFRRIMEQTDMNFVYSSEVLDGVNVTIDARNRDLRKVLNAMFRDTGIAFRIKGKSVVLTRKKKVVRKVKARVASAPAVVAAATPDATILREVVVTSRLESPAVESGEIGARKITAEEVRNAPALFGEADVIKALHLQSGVSEGTEGMAGMHVHGGATDENLCMLDNVPLYQVNHFAGLFSAFNTDVVRYIDFFRSSIPAKYDGRLSSFLDVRTRNGSSEGHHGTARLGLTSAAFSLSGPIGHRTTYIAAIRRSWFDVLTIPALAIVNSKSDYEDIRFRYYFMDLNGKITHRFSDRATGYASIYFGNDMLKTGSKDSGEQEYGWYEDETFRLHWGNLVAQTGLNYRFGDALTGEFTAAFTRFFSGFRHDNFTKEHMSTWRTEEHSDNDIYDWIFRADFDLHATEASRIRFGANYVRHSFQPGTTHKFHDFDDTRIESSDSTRVYRANEFNVYIEDDHSFGDHWHINAGLHASLFTIDGKTHYGLSPRTSASYRPTPNWAVKAAYSRTHQYVHQLSQTYLSLPTDQWIPIAGDFKPQTADKVCAGLYWQSENGRFAASAEGYYKWMRHLIDYCDEYYLRPPLEVCNHRLTSGKGTAKGIDLKVEKTAGKFTGHVAYSLAWTDRTFAEKNGGRTYPARFDNRHTINVAVGWDVSPQVRLNAAWTGHSGNRFTLLTQSWEGPDTDLGFQYNGDEMPLRAGVNNYQLPFYHRLDLSCTVRKKHGYWTFSLYNAYNHMNTIAVRRSHSDKPPYAPVFQRVKMIPVIPSVSYTWLF